MKTKNIFKKNLLALLVSIGFIVSPISALALDWGVGVNSNGNVSVGIGSSGSGAGAVWGGGGYGGGGGWTLSNPYGLPQGSLLGIASNLLFWLLMLFAIAGVLGFVISGIFYLISAGDEKTASKGKQGITWSIIGIAVGLSGFLIMQAVAALLSGTSKTF